MAYLPTQRHELAMQHFLETLSHCSPEAGTPPRLSPSIEDPEKICQWILGD